MNSSQNTEAQSEETYTKYENNNITAHLERKGGKWSCVGCAYNTDIEDEIALYIPQYIKGIAQKEGKVYCGFAQRCPYRDVIEEVVKKTQA